MVRAHDLIEGLVCDADAVMADRAYDADHLHDAILEAGAEPVIPPWRHRRRPHSYTVTVHNAHSFHENWLKIAPYPCKSRVTEAR